MSFRCPICGMEDLEILLTIELPPDARSDEVTLQLLGCKSCSFKGAAVYEESRRGALDSDCFNHYGHRLALTNWRELSKAIKACPEPRNRRCICESHHRLAACDPNGVWQGLQPFQPKDFFVMEYTRSGH